MSGRKHKLKPVQGEKVTQYVWQQETYEEICKVYGDIKAQRFTSIWRKRVGSTSSETLPAFN